MKEIKYFYLVIALMTILALFSYNYRNCQKFQQRIVESILQDPETLSFSMLTHNCFDTTLVQTARIETEQGARQEKFVITTNTFSQYTLCLE